MISLFWCQKYAALNYASKSYAQVIKRLPQYAVKGHWLPKLLQRFSQEVFQHAEVKFATRFALHHCRQKRFKPLHVAFTCTELYHYNYRFNRYWVGGQKKRDGYWYWKEPDGDIPMSCPMWVVGMLAFPTYGIGCWRIPKNSKWN